VVVGAFDKAVAFNGLDTKLNGNFDLNALGNDNVKVASARLLLALNERLAAALGFDSAELGVGADFQGNADVGKLNGIAFAVAVGAVALVIIKLALLFRAVAVFVGVICVHRKTLLKVNFSVINIIWQSKKKCYTEIR
jgi:hypothetical protein